LEAEYQVGKPGDPGLPRKWLLKRCAFVCV